MEEHCDNYSFPGAFSKIYILRKFHRLLFYVCCIFKMWQYSDPLQSEFHHAMSIVFFLKLWMCKPIELHLGDERTAKGICWQAFLYCTKHTSSYLFIARSISQPGPFLQAPPQQGWYRPGHIACQRFSFVSFLGSTRFIFYKLPYEIRMAGYLEIIQRKRQQNVKHFEKIGNWDSQTQSHEVTQRR